MEILSRIAGGFDPNSAPAITLRRSAIALFYSVTHHPDTFEEFCTNFNQVLTQEQKQKLKSLGLETDS